MSINTVVCPSSKQTIEDATLTLVNWTFLLAMKNGTPMRSPPYVTATSRRYLRIYGGERALDIISDKEIVVQNMNSFYSSESDEGQLQVQ